MAAQQGACSLCKLPYEVLCPIHPQADAQAGPDCGFARCSPEKHIAIPCDCDPDLWEVDALLNPEESCCAVGVCPRHEECERHGHCPPLKLERKEEDPCQYEYVGQCVSFFMGTEGQRARCSNSLDGVADSRVCPECVMRYYPRAVCETCGHGRRWVYDGISGAWMQVCPCDDKSSEEEENEERKKQKLE